MTAPGAPRTTIVSVAWNSADVLPAMLASIPQGVPVVVVDNAGTDASGEIARAAGAHVVRLEENLGFGRGCNAGAALADTEFLLFLNPDAALEPGALAALEAAADAYPDASGFNPRIRDRNGQAYFKRGSILLARRERLARGWPEESGPVPVLSGAAFFCRRAQFEAEGGFDPAIFLYHEDDDLSLRLKQRFGPLRFVREAEIVHLEGRGSPRNPETARIKSYHMARSRVYTMRKHGRPFPVLGSLAGAILKLLSPANLVSARKRAQALAYVKGVLSRVGERSEG